MGKTFCTLTVKVKKTNLPLLTLIMNTKGFTIYFHNKDLDTYDIIDELVTPIIDDGGYYTCIYNGTNFPARTLMRKIEDNPTISYTKERRVEA